jgi:hypothetical protein
MGDILGLAFVWLGLALVATLLAIWLCIAFAEEVETEALLERGRENMQKAMEEPLAKAASVGVTCGMDVVVGPSGRADRHLRGDVQDRPYRRGSSRAHVLRALVDRLGCAPGDRLCTVRRHGRSTRDDDAEPMSCPIDAPITMTME